MTTDEVLHFINSSTASTGGTVAGISRDEKATTCGLSAAFAESLPAHTFQVPKQVLDRKGKPVVIGNRAGSAFHALQEGWGTGRLDAATLPEPKAFTGIDEAVAAAILALKRVVAQDSGSPHYLGEVIRSEFAIEGSIAGEKRTGRLDRVVQASREHIDRWAEYGIFAALPGIYLWDFKLYKAVTVDLASAHQRKLQALAYMKLYEQQTGERPEGFVFELVSRAANPTESRLLVLVPNVLENDAIIEGFVQLATRRRLEGEADASKCDNRYGACPFINICPRAGNKRIHADLISNQALLRQVKVSEDDE